MKIKILKDPNIEIAIYTWLCIGIVYTLFFWTLLNSILCITFAAYWLLFSNKKIDIRTNKSRLMLLFFALYLIAVTGIFQTANMNEGLFRLQQKSAILLFPMILGTTQILNVNIFKKITGHFLIATVIACSVNLGSSFIQFFETGQSEVLTYHNISRLPDTYPYQMGLYCLSALIFIPDQLTGISKTKRNILIATALFLSVYIILLSIRLIIAAWALLMIFYALKNLRSLFTRIWVCLALLTVVIVSVIFNPSLQRQWIELTDFSGKNTIMLDQDASLGRSWGGKAIRLAIWKCSFDVIDDHWLTGVGTGDVQDSLQQAYENRKFYFASDYNRYNAHNEYIQHILAYGIVGLGILLLCIIVPFFIIPQHALKTGYYLFLMLFLFICCTESILNTNKGIIWYSFFNSIFAFTILKKSIPKPVHND